VNVVAFVVTVLLALLVAVSADPACGLLLAAWVGFLMLANGVLHIAGTLAHARYCPGVVTGTLVYLPFGSLVLYKLVRELELSPSAVLVSAALGAAPMLVHGYLIVFRASRLF
jgi:hypothetical protein